MSVFQSLIFHDSLRVSFTTFSAADFKLSSYILHWYILNKINLWLLVRKNLSVPYEKSMIVSFAFSIIKKY